MKSAELELKYFPILKDDLNHLLGEDYELTKKNEIYKLIDRLDLEIKPFQKQVNAFYKEHGQQVGTTDRYILPSDMDEKLKKEFNDLQNKKAKVKVIGITWADVAAIKSKHPFFAICKILGK